MPALIRRMAALLLCCAVLTCGLSALAAEETLDVTYIKITHENFVADSFNGVDALYNLYGSTYYCSEYITRYYEQVYGLTVRTSDSGPSVVGTDEYWFEVAETPKPGDVLYGSAAARGKGYSHWAVVKSYDEETGVMTLIEQNWRWNGQAGVNRQLAFPNSVYVCYTLCSTEDEIATLHEQAIAASWAAESLAAAEEAGIFACCGDLKASATREQFCEMVVNMVVGLTGEQILVRELPVDEDGSPDESWCAQAYAMGILAGGSDGSLDPDGTLTRAQAAVILARAYALVGTLPQTDPEMIEQFADSAAIGAWAADSVSAMAACGILLGDASGNFQPGAALTVEAAVTVAMRALSSLRVQLELEQLIPSEITNAAAEISRASLPVLESARMSGLAG